MNQGNLEVVKQEMARVNIDILGISELKWTGMGEFNSDDQYFYHCGQEPFRRTGVALIGNKGPKCSTCIQPQKNRMISVHFQGKPFSITVVQVCAQPVLLKKLKLNGWFYEYLQDLLELTAKGDIFFIIGDWSAK